MSSLVHISEMGMSLERGVSFLEGGVSSARSHLFPKIDLIGDGEDNIIRSSAEGDGWRSGDTPTSDSVGVVSTKVTLLLEVDLDEQFLSSLEYLSKVVCNDSSIVEFLQFETEFFKRDEADTNPSNETHPLPEVGGVTEGVTGDTERASSCGLRSYANRFLVPMEVISSEALINPHCSGIVGVACLGSAPLLSHWVSMHSCILPSLVAASI